jgi:hypothetical protein
VAEERLGDWCDAFGTCPRRWDTSMARVAEWLARRLGKSVPAARSMIQRLLDSPVPAACGTPPGTRWKQLWFTADVYRRAYRRGPLPDKSGGPGAVSKG